MYLVLSLLFFRSFARCFSPYLKLFVFFVRVFASLLFSVFMFLVSLLRSLLSVVIAFFPSLILFVFLSCVPPPHPPFQKNTQNAIQKKRDPFTLLDESEKKSAVNVNQFEAMLLSSVCSCGLLLCCRMIAALLSVVLTPWGGRRNLGGDAESK